MTQDAEVEAIEMRLLLDAIHVRYGYDLSEYAPESLQRRVRAALVSSGAPHLAELMHRALSSPEVFRTLLDDLTVQVSEMFRDPPFQRALRERVIPILRTYPQLKIWHAGCATGEEVYSTAILLEEEGLYERSLIYATDISQRAVDRAKEAIYPERAFQTFKQNHEASGGTSRLEDYFSRAYGRIAVHAELKRNVVFFRHNLAVDYAFGDMNLILCRNVLIYFGRELKQRVVRMFRKGLCRGGFLGLGSSEKLPGSHDGAFEAFVPSQPLYRLRSAE